MGYIQEVVAGSAQSNDGRKKLGKDEYWTPNLPGSKKIETMDMETGFIEEEFQDGEEEIVKDQEGSKQIKGEL